MNSICMKCVDMRQSNTGRNIDLLCSKDKHVYMHIGIIPKDSNTNIIDSLRKNITMDREYPSPDVIYALCFSTRKARISRLKIQYEKYLKKKYPYRYKNIPSMIQENADKYILYIEFWEKNKIKDIPSYEKEEPIWCNIL